jgi:hypothetical protein
MDILDTIECDIYSAWLMIINLIMDQFLDFHLIQDEIGPNFEALKSG